MHARARTHPHPHTHPLTHKHAHTHTLTLTHTHTHAHTRTQASTQVRRCSRRSVSCTVRGRWTSATSRLTGQPWSRRAAARTGCPQVGSGASWMYNACYRISYTYGIPVCTYMEPPRSSKDGLPAGRERSHTFCFAHAQQPRTPAGSCPYVRMCKRAHVCRCVHTQQPLTKSTPHVVRAYPSCRFRCRFMPLGERACVCVCVCVCTRARAHARTAAPDRVRSACA